ncbi:hypothetical protein N0B31_04555 [Salinirubellus salinus]|uniref:DUF7322 domain-containing protein n=1 Tax=Salinirubellus salinus TaxID=1364945 RepID=A0A9E7R565_9EURY|nr:hypothetical protein [Salinirubellus salinus]UWM55558.1 hypothetical protein N0B31_04555 [Salinirubellus salinus]
MSPFEEDEDAWPDEPKEFDPNSLGPDIPKAPAAPNLADRDAPRDVANAFWAAVIFANVGLLGVSLGPMLWYFEGMAQLGGGIFLVGVVALGMTYRRYYAFMNREKPEDVDHETDREDAPGGD